MRISGNKYPAHTRTCTLPGIKVTTQEILDALAQVAGPDAVKLVEIKPDITVQSITDTWAPEWKTDRAFSLGCKSDKNILDAVVAYKTMLDQGQG